MSDVPANARAGALPMSLDFETRNGDVPRDLRLGWGVKVAVFMLGALLVPGLENRELVFSLLAAILPVQIWWHRFLPQARMQSVRPLHDALVCTVAAALAPSLWVPAVLIYALGASDPAYRRRPKATNVVMGGVGVALLTVGAVTGQETWIPTAVVAAAMILLRGQTDDKVWSELEAAERHRNELLESVSAIVWTADPSTELVTWISPNIERVTGWTPQEWMATKQVELIHPDDVDDFWIDSSIFEPGREYVRAARYRHKDGSWIWLNMVMTPLVDRSGALQLYGHCTDATEIIEHQAKMHRQARSDELTGLDNRHVLLHELNERLGASQPRFALLMLDLDRFKEINDTLGHSIGDEVLRALGNRLREAAPDELVCRLGGDEFAVLITDPTSVGRIVHSIGELTSAPVIIDDVKVSSQVSIGSVIAPDDGDTVGDVLRRADAAMYQAKRRGQLHLAFTSDMERHNELELELSATLSTALSDGQFEVHFQPQIDLATGQVVGAEGLMRWNHPVHGVIRPGSFIHLVGLSNAHGRFADVVVDQACAFAAQASTPHQPFFVAVNISALSLFDPDFANRVARAIDTHDLEPNQLILEITESEIMDDHATSRDVIEELSALGVCLSIDDFGTGYSSLTRLVQLPVSEIKIDQSFVAGISANGPEQAVIEATIALGKRLGLQMVAEGIESTEQADFLAAHGCQIGQGYLFGQAVSAEEFLETFSRRPPDPTGSEISPRSDPGDRRSADTMDEVPQSI